MVYQASCDAKRWFRRKAYYLGRATLRAVGAVPVPTIFILGHMRSGSTLLLHILLTNPEIIGCGERNSPYHSLDDLDRLAITARIERRKLFRSYRYAVDQINHDRFTPCEALLGHSRVRLVFMTREPPAAISSIVKLGRDYYGKGSVGEAVKYYVQRLKTLARYAENLPPQVQALRLTYGELVEQSSITFARMQHFLGLKTGFTEQYALQQFTGRRGDPAKKIHVGHIVRERDFGCVTIRPDELDKAWQAYRACQHAVERFA